MEGEGFPVHRAFAGVPLEVLDPFIHMDQMGEVEYAAGEPKGTPWHPHRGFETFTYLIDGQFIHQDSNGGGGMIGDGGTQYMTAGDGILHIETPPAALVESGGLFHGLQLWINLPRAKKRIAPQYQDLQSPDLTLLSSDDGGALVRVLAGSVDGHAGPGISHTPLAITHITVSPGAQVTSLAGGVQCPGIRTVRQRLGRHRASAHPRRAAGRHGCGRVRRPAGRRGAGVATPNLEIFLIGGVPLREPVAAYGPFVMCSRRS